MGTSIENFVPQMVHLYRYIGIFTPFSYKSIDKMGLLSLYFPSFIIFLKSSGLSLIAPIN